MTESVSAGWKVRIIARSPFDFATLHQGQLRRRSNLSSDKDCFALLLRNKLSGRDRLGEEREAQAGGGAREVTNGAVTEVLVIGLLTLRLIRCAMGKDMVENASQFMRGGGDRRGWPLAGAQAAIITAQGRLRAAQGLGGQAQHLRRTAVVKSLGSCNLG